MKRYPSVSIIFPTYNGNDQVIDCIKSIKNSSYPTKKVEIIIIDNGSHKNFRSNGVKIIRNNKNLGFAKAINQGIKIAKAEFILITNDDVLFDKNSIKNLIGYYLGHKKIGVVGSSAWMMNKWTGNIYPTKNNKIIEPDWVSGHCLLIKKTVLKNVGLLDERFFFFFEDFDLCLKIKNKSLKIVSLPNVYITHKESYTINKNPKFKYYLWYKAKIQFILKNLNPLQKISILFLQTFIIIPTRTIILKDERLLPYLKALVWNIKTYAKF